MHDEIEILGGHVPVGAVIALFVLLARREGETQACGCSAHSWRRARAADGTHSATRMKAVVVNMRRLESRSFGVHGIRPAWRRDFLSAPHDAAKSLVGCDFPRYLDAGYRKI